MSVPADLDKFPPGMQAALAALYGPHIPMAAHEVAAFESAKARVKAADEAKRIQAQPDLLAGAA